MRGLPEALFRSLRDPVPEVREQAAGILGVIKVDDTARAILDLQRITQDSDPAVAAAAKDAVSKITRKADGTRLN